MPPKKKPSKAKGRKWKKLPKGWTPKSRRKFWETLTGDSKHPVTTCIEKMTGKVDDPAAFCAAIADRVLKRTTWRGKKKASGGTFIMLRPNMKLGEITEKILNYLLTGPGSRTGVVQVLDPSGVLRQLGLPLLEKEIWYGARSIADAGVDDANRGSKDMATYSTFYDLVNDELRVLIKEVRPSKSTRQGFRIQVKPPLGILLQKARRMGQTKREHPDRWDPQTFLPK